MKRRDFLKLSATSLLGSSLSLSHKAFANLNALELELKPETQPWFIPAYAETQLWGIDQEIIRLQQHQFVAITVNNQLPEPSTLHWHGMRVPNAMDGVSGLLQKTIQPKGSFTYQFVAKDAGTYWVHSHHNTYEQLARGVYAPLIVQEKDPYPVDQDIVMVLDDWLVNAERQLDLKSLGNMHEWAHSGRYGNILTVNRQLKPSIQVKAGQRIRLRLLNAANARIMALELKDLSCWILAKDGQPLQQPEALTHALVIGPAERYDLIVDIPANWSGLKPIYEISKEQALHIANWQVEATSTVAQAVDQPQPLPDNLTPLTDQIKADHSVHLNMEGGAMGGLQQGIYKNKTLSMREMISQKQIWTFNGIANLADKPLLSVKSGQIVELTISNNTRWPHGMHLHGHHFKAASPHYPKDIWHDTLLMAGGEETKIRFRAGEPGKWLLHCHMIEHQASGMVAWIQVT